MSDSPTRSEPPDGTPTADPPPGAGGTTRDFPAPSPHTLAQTPTLANHAARLSDLGAARRSPPHVPGYDLHETIGEGGMGVVYRARERALDRDVAVKFLQDHYPPDSAAARRFLEEARITGQLQHPAIPPVHHIGTLPDGRPFLAMKFIKGRTLAELLAAESDAPRAADRGRFVSAFAQVCQANGTSISASRRGNRT